MFRSIFPILAFCLTIFVIGQNSPKPVIEFDSETIDLGNIKLGGNIEKTIVFRNTGKAPLIVKKLECSSSDININEVDNEIMPSGKGKIVINFNFSKTGPLRRTISVFTNSTTPVKILKIKGKII